MVNSVEMDHADSKQHHRWSPYDMNGGFVFFGFELSSVKDEDLLKDGPKDRYSHWLCIINCYIMVARKKIISLTKQRNILLNLLLQLAWKISCCNHFMFENDDSKKQVCINYGRTNRRNKICSPRFPVETKKKGV